MASNELLEFIKSAFIKRGYTEDQIEYVYGIAQAILVNVPTSIPEYRTKMNNQVAYLLRLNHPEWNFRTRMFIRWETLKLGNPKQKSLLENIIELERGEREVSRRFKDGYPRELLKVEGPEGDELIERAKTHGDISETSNKGHYKIDRNFIYWIEQALPLDESIEEVNINRSN